MIDGELTLMSFHLPPDCSGKVVLAGGLQIKGERRVDKRARVNEWEVSGQSVVS